MSIIGQTAREFATEKFKQGATGFLTGALGGTVGGAIASAVTSGGSGARQSGAQTGATGDPAKDTVNAIRDLQSDFNGQASIQKEIAGTLQNHTRILGGIEKALLDNSRALEKIYNKLSSTGSGPNINLGGGPDIGRPRPRAPSGGAGTLGRMGGLAGRAAGGIGGVLGGMALDYGADYAAERGYTRTSGALGTASYAATGAGLGMMLGPVGAAVGAGLGGAYGLYQNWGKLTGGGGQTAAMAELTRKQEIQKEKAASELEKQSITYNSQEIIFKAGTIKFETTGGGTPSSGTPGMPTGPSSTPTDTGPGSSTTGQAHSGATPKADQQGMTTLKTSSGKPYTVASQYADNFKGFVDALEGSGYKINSIGGYSNRTTASGGFSWHSKGMAIDINPSQNPHTFPGSPNYGKTDMPDNVGQLAARFGLGWGGNWRSSKDTMHFSMGGNEGGQSNEARGGQMAGGAQTSTGGGGAGAGGSITASSAVPGGASVPLSGIPGGMGGRSAAAGRPAGGQQEFYNSMYQSLYEAAKARGLKNPEVIAQLGATQASLESGYGRRMVGNNAFGIKGGGVTAMTQEFVGGRMVSMPQSFRRYGDVTEGAGDYIDMMIKNKRIYGGVLNASTIEEALAAQGKSGYATDPGYGAKLAAVHRRMSGGLGDLPAPGASAVQGRLSPSEAASVEAAAKQASIATRGRFLNQGQFGPNLPAAGEPMADLTGGGDIAGGGAMMASTSSGPAAAREPMADLTGGMDIAGGGAMFAGAAVAAPATAVSGPAQFQNMGKSSEFANQKLGGAPVKPKASTPKPRAKSTVGGPSADEVRSLWEKYNETQHPADFVRADNAMKAMQAAQAAAGDPVKEGSTGGRKGKGAAPKKVDLGPASMYGESDAEYRARIAGQDAAAAEGAPGYEGMGGKILTHAQQQVADLEAERNRRLAEEESIDDAERIRAPGERGKLEETNRKDDAVRAGASPAAAGMGFTPRAFASAVGGGIEESREKAAAKAANARLAAEGAPGFEGAAGDLLTRDLAMAAVRGAPDTGSSAGLGAGFAADSSLNIVSDGAAAARMSENMEAYKLEQLSKASDPSNAYSDASQMPAQPEKRSDDLGPNVADSAIASSQMLRDAFGDIPNLGMPL